MAVLGNFDGVHAGHLALIAKAKTQAEALGLPLVALTFWPHPRTILNPEHPITLLQTLPERIASLQAAGLEGVAVVPFNASRMGQVAEDFVADILHNWLHAKAVAVGENFKFGHKAQGTPALIAGLGIPCSTLALVSDAGGVLSSSRLRFKVL